VNSPRLVLVLVLFFKKKWKQNDGLYRFEYHRSFIWKQIFLGFIIIIIITMSFAQTGLDNIALHKQKGNVLTLDL
jgi:hypothetical protein